VPGSTQFVNFDGYGRQTKSRLASDPSGTTYQLTAYDSLGRESQVFNPTRCNPPGTNCGEATWGYTTYSYDALGRTTTVTSQDGGVSTSTFNGNAVTVSDQAGKKRKTVSDALGRLTKVFENPDGLNYETDYQYDALGNLLRVDQKGSAPSDSSQWRTRQFTYDSLSRLLTAANPESGTITYTYDANGNVATKTDARGIITSFHYDALNRITSKDYSDSTLAVGFVYDQTGVWGVPETNTVGRLVLEGDGVSADTIFSYDAVGRINKQWDCTPSTFGVGCPPISAQYDLAGDLTQLTYPNTEVVKFAFNAAGRATSAIDDISNINFAQSASYGPDGSLTGFVSGQCTGFNGFTNVFTYNNRLQPCRMTASTAGLPANCADTDPTHQGNVFDITYDFHLGSGNNGNVWGITNNRDSSRSQTFTYDQLNRLSSAQNAGTDCGPKAVNNPNQTIYWGNTYGYDAWGNLQNKTVTKCSAELLSAPALANNRLSGYSYDAAGNMTNDGLGHSFTYDAESRIAQVNSGAAQYTYDGAMGRVRKDVTGQPSTEYYYFGNQVLAEKNISTGNWTNYIFFAGDRIARREYPAGDVFYYFSDHLNTTSVVRDSAGGPRAESDYYSWGGEIKFVYNDSNHYKFTGKERDSESGLDYFGARYYSNGLGRFITPDWAAKATAVPYGIC
jgi:RHS repeat-associated protein